MALSPFPGRNPPRMTTPRMDPRPMRPDPHPAPNAARAPTAADALAAMARLHPHLTRPAPPTRDQAQRALAASTSQDCAARPGYRLRARHATAHLARHLSTAAAPTGHFA